MVKQPVQPSLVVECFQMTDPQLLGAGAKKDSDDDEHEEEEE
jgi:hypothetical protein